MPERTISGVTMSNIFYTLLIFINHFVFGLTSNIIWPALEDLGFIYSNTEKIYLTATFASTGYTIGSLSGFLYKWLNRQITVSVMLLINSLTLFMMPFFPSTFLLFVAITFNGAGGGTWDSNNNVWLSEIWKERSQSVLQFSQFMYGVGSIVGPIIVSPYLHGSNQTDNSTSAETRKKELQIPFSISGAAQALVPIIFIILFFINRYRKPKTVSNYEVASTEENADRNEQEETIKYRLTKIGLMGLVLAAYGAVEISYFYFSPTMFQYLKPISFSAEQSAHLSSILSAAYTIGRLITVFISLKLSSDVIISYHYFIITFSFVLLYFGRAYKSIIYGGTVLLGYGFSAMWPAILAFTAKYLRLTDRSGAFIFFMDGFACLLTPLMIGPYLTEENSAALFIILQSYLIISIFFFVILRVLIYFK